MIRRPPRSTLSSSSAASDVYKRQVYIQNTTFCSSHYLYNVLLFEFRFCINLFFCFAFLVPLRDFIIRIAQRRQARKEETTTLYPGHYLVEYTQNNFNDPVGCFSIPFFGD